jgi:beta-galactosidase
VRLAEDGEVLDEAETVFGIRQITWSTEGFFVNGKSIKLKGGCIHSDNGILGARCFDEAEWRRVRRLREFGFNAIRSAHNPLCRAALEACDALGMYVMDETWDMWDQHKTDYDYAGRFTENWRQDVRYMIAKDYNHPSVVLYSIGNEVTEPAKPEGVQLAADIIKEIKCFDTTRPVTGGINIMLILLASKGVTFNGGSVDGKVSSTEFNEWVAGLGKKMLEAAASPDGDEASSPVLELLDIAGYNYAQSRYEKERELHPERIVVGSETFPQDLPGNWALVTKCPWVIGDFMWTAWDYIGEVGIGDWVSDEDCQGFGKP